MRSGVDDSMKVVQIFRGQIHRDLSDMYSSAEEGMKHYSPDIMLVNAPDYVFPGWGYNSSMEGDARFVKPAVPEGMEYDMETGTVWDPELLRSDERRARHAETTNDTLEAYRKLRQGDKTIDWQAWLDELDAYNVAIEETKNQEGYPLKVTYPEYPTKPTA